MSASDKMDKQSYKNFRHLKPTLATHLNTEEICKAGEHSNNRQGKTEMQNDTTKLINGKNIFKHELRLNKMINLIKSDKNQTG